MNGVFPIDDFNMRFPEFTAQGTEYTIQEIQRAGQEAMMHITPDVDGMPMHGMYRGYALFLMTAHILILSKSDSDSATSGETTSGGSVFKATVGSVTTEMTKPNSFTTDDWSYWLNQTGYGRKLLAYLDVQAPCGIYSAGGSARDLV